MDYYLLSEQDLKELIWDLEIFFCEVREKIQKKKIEEPVEDDNDGVQKA